MNRIGGKSNTGEGGEHPSRFRPQPDGDSKRSSIKQVASGRFGVTSIIWSTRMRSRSRSPRVPNQVKAVSCPEVKSIPGSPNAAGLLPVSAYLSAAPSRYLFDRRFSRLIHDLKNANPRAKISVKLVSEVGVGTIAAGVVKACADVVLISGYDGGTVASPRTSINHAGLPGSWDWMETHQTLLLNNLRNRVTLETDGKLMTGRDVIIAALLGAKSSALPLRR